MKTYSKQRYILGVKRIAIYDGRRKYPYNDVNNQISGYIHQAKKDLNICNWCNEQIKEGDIYVDKNALMLVDLPRVHLECDIHDTERLYVIKTKKTNYFYDNFCERLSRKNINEFVEKRFKIKNFIDFK